jgi:hypothetical protein
MTMKEDEASLALADKIIELAGAEGADRYSVAGRLAPVKVLTGPDQVRPVEALVLRVTGEGALKTHHVGDLKGIVFELGKLLFAIYELLHEPESALKKWLGRAEAGYEGVSLVRKIVPSLTPLSADETAVIWALYVPASGSRTGALAVEAIAEKSRLTPDQVEAALQKLMKTEPPIVRRSSDVYELNQAVFFLVD